MSESQSQSHDPPPHEGPPSIRDELAFWRERTGLVLAVSLLFSLVLVTPRVAESDAVEYFSYLPSVLLDFDLDFTDEYTYFYEEDPVGRAGFKETFLDRSTATGLKLNFGPIGSAVLWAPFYVLAHLIVLGLDALGADVTADGMSQPYRTAVTFASALYGAVGLFLCYRIARRFVEPFPSVIAVLALWWATPVAYYMYIAPGMSHAPSLFAVAVFFFLWPWATEGGVGRWAIWGASAGLMALVREQDLLFAIAAPVAALSGFPRVELRRRFEQLAAFGLGAIVVFSPQLLVYQILNGHPSPSPHVQNKMDYLSPYSIPVLFSSEHGLFFWSPLLLLLVVAGIALLRKRPLAASALLLGFLLQVYISGAVESWTQAGAFGSRRFVGATPIFAVWGAFFFAWLVPRFRRAGAIAVVALFVTWNVSLMIQFGLNLMNRQKLVWTEIMHNHVHEVPQRTFSVVGRYLTSRSDLAGSTERP